ncbi:helix-turn-helix transcriptional regulator [Chitinophaga sp. G-6-1-13]|uniref:Helix-turn-helix transcriptional regulator n=1 Tax=Chitinophaga fulva TaxID=2728842 RepID=A0A848GMY7_9BACT|nr:helix-turn-helix transcriptional regulator [Chitinophaga fulva]NML38040.1 helix-turn-helix transcriptional regulator [Chitinophaga fulva]
MPEKNNSISDPAAFTAAFMPGMDRQAVFKAGREKFFILKVEDMYRHLKGSVPASKSTMHSCLFLTEGSALMKVGSDSCEIYENELLFVAAGQMFSFSEGDANNGYLCVFHDDMLIGRFVSSMLGKDFECLRAWGNPVVRPDSQTAGFILQLLLRLYHEYRQQGIQRPDIIQSYLIALLTEVNAVYRPLQRPERSAALQLMNRFHDLLFTGVPRWRQVADLAAQLHISPNHLNKIVKQVTGKSPIRWIDEATVLEAKILLSQQEMPVGEIALTVGIEDASYFTRLFKKYEGVTPTAFRGRIEKS